eukprot:PhM_4_TR196/c0_g1_i1/m.3474/K00854/xylB, XYLB; xylulokinase
MWIEALDDVLRKMAAVHSLKDVRAVSVSGQQHGSVYWRFGAQAHLKTLRPEGAGLLQQVLPALLLPYAPVWRDHSTGAEVEALTRVFGSPDAAFDATGSRVTHRFTGPQIMKIRQDVPGFDQQCERVSLVSSFITSLLCGCYAPIDVSDGSGMNLLNLQTMTWDPRTEGVVPARLLRSPVPSSTVVGHMCSYWTKYGFSKDCAVVAGSGDNNNALVGSRVLPEDIAISLGTSDTVMQTISRVPPSSFHGHVFAHPTLSKMYMSLLCFTNGALARRAVCVRCCDGDWKKFETMLASTRPGNKGYMGLFYDTQESVPPSAHGQWRGRYRGDRLVTLERFPRPEVEVRAIIEAQVLALRLFSHLERNPKRVVVTGGASQSKAICQVIADVFGCDVFVGKDAGGNAAAFGAALRAKLGVEHEGDTGVVDLLRRHPAEDVLVAKWDAPTHAVYSAMIPRLRTVIQNQMDSNNGGGSKSLSVASKL